MAPKKICIIEDEADIIRLLSYNLAKEGYEVASHTSGNGATAFIKTHQPALILLDLMIPEIDGFEVCKLLKTNSETKHIPIIMLTAKADETTIATGLELGADDYITKPFSIVVLIARIRTALRRTKIAPADTEKSLFFKQITIHPDRHEVLIDNAPVKFSHTEFKLLHCLALQPGRVFSRNQIIDFMKGEDYFVTDRLVDVLLVSIRKKLGPVSGIIETIRGVGYKLKDIE